MSFLNNIFASSAFLTCFAATAATVKTLPTEIRSRLLENQNIVLEVCEAGSCSALGNDDGYSLSDWKEIGDICRDLSLYGDLKTNLLKIFVTIAMIPISPVTGVLVATAIPQYPLSAPATDAAGHFLPGLVQEKGQFLSPGRELFDLIDGINHCAYEWEWNKIYLKVFYKGWGPLG